MECGHTDLFLIRIKRKLVLCENAVSEATFTVLYETVNAFLDYEFEKVEVQPAPTLGCVLGTGGGKRSP